MNKECRDYLANCAQQLTSDKCLQALKIPINVMDRFKTLKDEFSKPVSDQRLITLAFVGEFNAGKSTLINAILKRQVAFVDPFEATTCIAVITPGQNEGVQYEDSHGRINNISIDQYLKRCASRHLEGVKRADITVNHTLPVVIIDTPGMGSITANHEELAEAAIMDNADQVIWMMDVADMLSAKDSAFLQRARSINLPVWCVLSKSDELSPGEVTECVSEIIRATGVDVDDVIALSAHNYMQNGHDEGVDRLISKISKASSQVTQIKNAAEAAKHTELFDEFISAFEQVYGVFCEVDKWLINEALILKEEAAIVVKSVVDSVRTLVHDEVVRSLDSYAQGLRQSGTTLNADASQAINLFLTNRLPALTDHITHMIETKVKSAWNEQFDGRSSDLNSQIRAMLHDEMIDADTMAFLKDQLSVVQERKEAVKYSFGIVPAVLGAAILHFIAEPVSGTANLIATIAGAFTGHSIGKHIEDASAVSYTINNVALNADRMAACIADVIAGKHMEPKVRVYADKVALNALSKRCEQRIPGVNYEEFQSTRKLLDGIKTGIHHIGTSGSLHPHLPTIVNAEASNSTGEGDSRSKLYTALHKTIHYYQIDIIESSIQLHGLLLDECPESADDVALLMKCLDAGIVHVMKGANAMNPTDQQLSLWIDELCRKGGMSLEDATWVVNTWRDAMS